MQNIKGILKSTNDEKDIFNNPAPFNEDHIWPKSRSGTNAKINKLKLSKISNADKKDLTSGEVNGFRFAIERATTKKDKNGNQTIYGILYIEKKGDWYKVTNG